MRSMSCRVISYKYSAIAILLLFWRQNENTARITRNFNPFFLNKTRSIQYFFGGLDYVPHI